jgi:hypothetical protein
MLAWEVEHAQLYLGGHSCHSFSFATIVVIRDSCGHNEKRGQSKDGNHALDALGTHLFVERAVRAGLLGFD